MHLDWQLVLIYALSGIVLLVVLWPTVSGGQRFLRRWGVKEPTEAQGSLARKYLLDRRLLYPPLFLAAPIVTQGDDRFLPTLVLALLLAEIIGMLRPVRGPRSATLMRRAWGDLVQRWAVVGMLVLGVFAVVLAVATRIAQRWARGVVSGYPPGGRWMTDGNVVTEVADASAIATNPMWLIVIVIVVLATVAVLGIVWLAVHRGAIADLQVDAALRTRSARVAVGIGIALMATSVGQANNQLTNLRDVHWPVPAPGWLTATGGLEAMTLPLLLIAAAGWIWVANPATKMPYVQATQAAKPAA